MARRRECAAAFLADLRSTLPPAATELAPVATQVGQWLYRDTRSATADRAAGRPAECWPHARRTPPAAADRGSRPRHPAPVRHRPPGQGFLPAIRQRQPPGPAACWKEDGWLGGDVNQLAVVLPDGTLAGIVGWRTIKTAGPEGGCLEIGVLLFPKHRGKGYGTAAQRLLAGYLFATTLANRLQAITDVENSLSSGRWSAPGSAVRASCGA
jgi:GNAT superfamily N-acetyltransferase